MNVTRSAARLGLAALFIASTAQAASDDIPSPGPVPWTGFYVAGGVSADFMPVQPLDIRGFQVNSKWRPGWGILGAVGYKTAFGLRPELELSMREQKDKDFNTSAAPWFGTQWDLSYMLNLLYDIHTHTRFTPYLGGGIGGTHITWGDNFKGLSPTIYDGTHTKFGWQLIAGVTYALTSRFDLNLDYRYKRAGTFASAGNAPGALINNWNYRDDSLVLSVRYALR